MNSLATSMYDIDAPSLDIVCIGSGLIDGFQTMFW